MKNCVYCGKSIPDNSRFCVYCGKDLSVAKEESLITKCSHKITNILNITILFVATCCIAGFIYYSIANKARSTADKSKDHEEVIGNLYRNKKYKFRIKYPVGWEIKKGDGPNILTKAVNKNGSSVIIYVKDLGTNLGNITELFTLDEWSESIHEKFLLAKILDRKEVSIDNEKAFFVKYSIMYKALDQQADVIALTVALTHNNFMYTINASSKNKLFPEEESLLKESIRSFVLESY
ncbi:MAG: zinc-ribbon domain-containing protein [Bacteroidetes bacterium]|nr:zinc-ribbon domain-containing protein [Bacteroidota bacterium]